MAVLSTIGLDTTVFLKTVFLTTGLLTARVNVIS